MPSRTRETSLEIFIASFISLGSRLDARKERKWKTGGFWKFLDNSISGSNFYQNLNCLISVRSRRVFLRSSLSLKLVTSQFFKSQCLPCSFFFISNHALWLKAIYRSMANSYFSVLWEFSSTELWCNGNVWLAICT